MRRNVVRIAHGEAPESDRRIEVIKNPQRMADAKHVIIDARALRTIAPHYHHIRFRSMGYRKRSKLIPVFVELKIAVIAANEVAAQGVVFYVLFEEDDFVPPPVQSSQQRAVMRGVPVAPGRRQRETKDAESQGIQLRIE